MKYLILIYSNPMSREAWEGFSEQDRTAGLDMYAALDAALADSGELIASERLGDPALSKRVWVREGQITTTDAPLAEVKELLGGFYLVDTETEERAIEIAAGVPEAFLGLIEVRPVMDLRGSEW